MKDYQEHQQEIHSKLIAIMGDRLTAHIKSLQVNIDAIPVHSTIADVLLFQAVNWNNGRETVNDYMTMLVKETVTLHKVLSRYLPEGILEVGSLQPTQRHV